MILVKYDPSLMVGPLSGSAGSTTASHNWAGHYFRVRTIPVNPNSPSQTSSRVAFTNFAQNWRNLTPTAQHAWADLAVIDPTTDSLGKTIVLTGIAYYCGFNMTRRSVGLARLDVAPPLVEVPPAVISAIQVCDGTLGTMEFTPTTSDGTATNFLLLSATHALSNGVTFIGRSDFRIIGVLAGDEPAIPPEDLAALYEAVFDDTWQSQFGMKIGFRYEGVSDLGFKSDFLQTLTEITV